MADTKVGSDVAGVGEVAKAFSKLLDVVASGVGALGAPWQKRRLARAEVDVERIRLEGEKSRVEGERELARLRALPPAGDVLEGELIDPAQEAMPLLLDRTKHRLDYQEGKRQLNVEQVAAFAADELRDCPDAQVSDAPVDEDWTARFFESVKDVSADDMQKLWAKILAGEVKQPGSFSLRCLDTLRNLSRAEAELFTRVVPFVIDGEALHADSVTRRAGLSFTNVVRLSDAGLLGGQLQMEWSLDCKQSEARDLVLPADFVIEFVPRKTGKQVFPCYPLTEAGRQLLRVLSVEPNIGFVRALAEHLAVSNSDVTVYRGDDVFEAPAPTVPAVTTDTKSTDGTLT